MSNTLYVIRNKPTIEESLHLEFEVYEELRNAIIKQLLNFYEKVDYKDADWRHYELLICCKKGDHLYMNAFNVPEWLEYFQAGSLIENMEKRLAWCKWNFEQAGFIPKKNYRTKVR